MCTFKITSLKQNLFLDKYLKLGGPTLTRSVVLDDITFTHNLLSVTGEVTPQPIERDGKLFFLLGEIYNYNRAYPSDIYTVIESYLEHGDRFTEYLDGEFLIIIYDKGKIHFFTDPWSTRMVWYTSIGDDFCFSTFPLSNNAERLLHNSHYCFDVKTRNLVQLNSELHKWDLNQTKSNFDDWHIAFNEAVVKRWNDNTVLALSGGVDSSSIAVCMAENKLPFDAISLKIKDSEDKNTTDSVLTFVRSRVTIDLNVVDICSIPETGVEYEFLKRKSFHRNPPAVLAYETQKLHKKVLFTGHGSDEIYDNYRMKSHTRHNEPLEFDIWPDDLSSVFPYKHFYKHKQRYLIDSHEYMALCFGVETRNPFLDKKLTQEWFSLSAELKNLEDKSPQKNYLRNHNIILPKKVSGLIDQLPNRNPNMKVSYDAEKF